LITNDFDPDKSVITLIEFMGTDEEFAERLQQEGLTEEEFAESMQ